MKHIKIFEDFQNDYYFITDLFIEIADRWNLKEKSSFSTRREFDGKNYRFTKNEKTIYVVVQIEPTNDSLIDHKNWYTSIEKSLDPNFTEDIKYYQNRVCNYYNGLKDDVDRDWDEHFNHISNKILKKGETELSDDEINKMLSLTSKIKKNKILSRILYDYIPVVTAIGNPNEIPRKKIVEMVISFDL